MIELPLGPEPVATPVAARKEEAQEQPPLRLLVRGFTPSEQELLQGVVSLSRRRAPHIELLHPAAAADADVIMIDTTDAAAMAWASKQAGLKQRIVIWVEGRSAPSSRHTLLKRPVQWPVLPMVLQRAMLRGSQAQATRQPAAPRPAAPADHD